ncbi:MAG: hypothetical protein AAFQ80_03650 [Cyanobacteria bacterium J06621_8]
MKLGKRSKIKIIFLIPAAEKSQKSRKSIINPQVLKSISVIIITLSNWLYPETAIAILLIRLLFILLEWLNQNKK